MAADRHTHNFHKCSHTSVGLAQGRPNNPIGQPSYLNMIFTFKQHSTVEHDFYKLTTTIKLLRSNHYCHSRVIRRHAATANDVWWTEGRSLCVAWLLACYWQSVDSNEGIPKVASLFKHHLNIDPVSLFESEGANQSLVGVGKTFTCKHAASSKS